MIRNVPVCRSGVEALRVDVRYSCSVDRALTALFGTLLVAGCGGAPSAQARPAASPTEELVSVEETARSPELADAPEAAPPLVSPQEPPDTLVVQHALEPVAWAPDGGWYLGASDAVLGIVDADSGLVRATFAPPLEGVEEIDAIEVDRALRRVMVVLEAEASDTAHLEVLDLETGRFRTVIEPRGEQIWAAMHPDGDRFAALIRPFDNGQLEEDDTASLSVVGPDGALRELGRVGLHFWEIDFAAGGSRLVLHGGPRGFAVHSASDGARVFGANDARSAAVDADGEHIVVVSADGARAVVHRAVDGERVRTFRAPRGSAWTHGRFVSADRVRLRTEDQARDFSLETGRPLGRHASRSSWSTRACGDRRYHIEDGALTVSRLDGSAATERTLPGRVRSLRCVRDSDAAAVRVGGRWLRVDATDAAPRPLGGPVSIDPVDLSAWLGPDRFVSMVYEFMDHYGSLWSPDGVEALTCHPDMTGSSVGSYELWPRGGRYMSVSAGFDVSSWCLQGEAPREIAGAEARPLANGRWIVSRTFDGLAIFATRSPETVRQIRLAESEQLEAASADGMTLVVVGDRFVRVLRRPGGREACRIPRRGSGEDRIRVEVSADGALILISERRARRVFSPDTGCDPMLETTHAARLFESGVVAEWDGRRVILRRGPTAAPYARFEAPVEVGQVWLFGDDQLLVSGADGLSLHSLADGSTIRAFDGVRLRSRHGSVALGCAGACAGGDRVVVDLETGARAPHAGGVLSPDGRFARVFETSRRLTLRRRDGLVAHLHYAHMGENDGAIVTTSDGRADYPDGHGALVYRRGPGPMLDAALEPVVRTPGLLREILGHPDP